VKRVAVLCPGRGSYTEKQLRSLPGEHPWVSRAEELRAEYGKPPVLELDRAPKFDPSLHLAPANVSPLIYLVTMLDAAAAMQEHRAVSVAGNSMGWYTALAVAGALDFDAGFRLVQEMSILQEAQQASEKSGGQLIYPLVDESWRADPKRCPRSISAATRCWLGAKPALRISCARCRRSSWARRSTRSG